ncbi:PKD domain-containing protein [Pseudarthrobacter sp. 1C304]|uniref:PKD domain-containing protein n=1 Tax=Pseudarthrobacter sp. 1C304 TaxID=3457438 RepID=UPI003FD3652E
MKRTVRWLSQALVMAVVVTGSILGITSPATAAADYGYAGNSFTGVSNPPTSDKPQSKLWWHDGSWWADMWTTGTGWQIYRLDVPTKTWVSTGLTNDTRASTLADTLWDGTHLYIASHVVTVSGDTSPRASVAGQPARLYRYSYSGGTFRLDSGFPTTIMNNSSESMTIDQDSTGAIWATWTQVAGNATSGFTNTVYVNRSAAGGTSWDTPFVLPVTNPNPAPDDISAVVAYGGNKIGVMWSDQRLGAIRWATRTDGTSSTATSSWRVQDAVRGNGLADDHLNVKTLQSDTAGRVFAAIKTGLNDTAGNQSLAQLQLLVFRPGTGAFTTSTIATVADCVSRPQIVLDTQNNTVHAFHTAPGTDVSGCAFSGTPGAIYEKTASMDNPAFPSGRGTPIIQDGASANMNDVTTSKQSVNNTTGLVVLASNNVTKRYWFSYRTLGGTTPPPTPAAPVASFTASPLSGTAPLTTAFTDTSTGTPTSWAWSFGDGGTSTAQNPSHTYTTAGTYTATLTATNAGGSTSANRTITVTTGTTPPPTTAAITTVASTTTNNTATTTSVTLNKPAGTAAGDVLVASFTADKNPTATAPAGWTAIVNNLSISSGARAFAYYRVVGASDPASYTWTLSTAVKWGGGITAYRGVNNTTPLDSTVATATNTTYTASSIAAPSITTASNNALLIGGVGFDSSTPGATAPTGWTERWEATDGQIAQQADRTQATAGATGTATWTFNTAKAVAVWRTALKPGAGTGGTTPPPTPAAPVASFTASPLSGTAPLTTAFTDTSTGTPTSWAWSFGDGGTSTAQNPSHTYTTAGTYTATLTATNAGGSTSANRTITVTTGTTPPPTTAAITTVASTTTNNTATTTSVTLNKPAGTAAGDVLVASFTADKNPTATAPAGWTAIVNNLSISSGARAFAYYRVVGASDPASYTWTLSTAVKWGGGITAYRGVNNTTPLDSTVATATNTTYTASSIAAPSITTASNNALLIGGVGFDSSTPGATAPTGWTERWEATDGQIAQQADRTQATAGATGTATWTFNTAKAVAVWRTALKPAS